MDASADPPISLNCVVEEGKILKGFELVLTDNLNEAEEYFEAMRPGSFRYSLYHAEVAVLVALISCEGSDIQRAHVLLTETETLAGQLAHKFRTHSSIRKVNAAVSNIKSWALGKISKRYSAMVAPAVKYLTPETEDSEQVVDPAKIEEKVLHHRLRRARLWALQIQAECHLMSSILQIVDAAESWSSVVKVGYSLRRMWGLYQHCRNKLKQLTKEWIAMDGSFDFKGDFKNVEEDESSSESDEEEAVNTMEGFVDMDGSQRQHEDVSSAGKSSGQYSSFMASQSNEECYPQDQSHGTLLMLDVKKGVKEDTELHSLRIGVQFGEGAFNLILSLIPASYQKALEVMRFPANRERGISLLRKVCAENHPAAPLASIMLLYYQTAIVGLLPFSSRHAKEVHELMDNMPSMWKSCSLFRILSSRLARYERFLEQATVMVTLAPENPYGLSERGNLRKIRSLMLDELGWCLLLQGKFSEAASCFSTLLQESVSFKVHYAFLLSSCLWEASESAQQQAGQLLKEIPDLVGLKKQQQLTPLEQYAVQVSSKFNATNQAPLFSALELAAVFSGFQYMDEASLEAHKRLVEEVLQGWTQTQSHKAPPNSNNQDIGVVQDLLSGESSTDVSSGKTLAKPRLHYEHKWTRSSKMICRFILGVCQKNLGELEKADDHLRYVIDNSEVICGNIVPYSCYELGSMLLQQDANSTEGMLLLEQSLSYPAHEFQGRLRLVAGELGKLYGHSSICTDARDNAAQPGVSGVSGQLKEKLVLMSKHIWSLHDYTLKECTSKCRLGTVTHIHAVMVSALPDSAHARWPTWCWPSVVNKFFGHRELYYATLIDQAPVGLLRLVNASMDSHH
ncbi:hypothetical protein GOP47_0018088 [Adiantum capillus-veneris]|uniref:Uncharacterized protein n=1 Tax=Adiantum capillus-veneris TaxID=13818 RepID=A0A9D4UGV6_ADICA|nr:hypothetical protein GOP47_0018088 [Adiantum capillus-veneris]